MEQPYGHDSVIAAAEGGVGGTGGIPVGHVAAAEHPTQGHGQTAPGGGGPGGGIVVDNSNMYNVPGGVAAPAPPVAPHPHAHIQQHHPIAPAPTGLVGGAGGGSNPPGHAFAYDPAMHQQHQHQQHHENNVYTMPNSMPGMVPANAVPTSVDAMHHPGGEQVAAAAGNNAAVASGKKKRLCKVEGCQRVIKSQGLCQRHGASAKRCKVPGEHNV